MTTQSLLLYIMIRFKIFYKTITEIIITQNIIRINNICKIRMDRRFDKTDKNVK